MKETTIRNLSGCERMIMRVIWDAGKDITTGEIIDGLNDKFGKVYARTTVVTFLKRLMEKGYVSSHRQGKKAFLHAEKDGQEYRTYLMNQEKDFWFEGDIVKLLSSMNLTKEDVEGAISYLQTL